MADRFFIVTNDAKDKDHRVTEQVTAILERAGKTCLACRKDGQNNIVRDQVPADLDCGVVIGGDGSLIELARVLKGRDVPILGINMGTLGYLTEVEVGHIDEAMAQFLRGDYVAEKRMMLEGSLGDGCWDIALNDIVVARKGTLRAIHFHVYVNGELLNSYEADGIIISTPTGSTAYNLSAGGPIVAPTASMILLTLICPHVLNSRSIVLSAEDRIAVKIGEARHNKAEEACVAFDGADVKELATGDMVEIRKSGAVTRIIKLSRDSFLDTLRRKMKGN